MKKTGWKLLGRKTIYRSKYMDVFDDKVRLPDKTVFESYVVVKKPDIVIIVATTKNEIILIDEYKYAADKIMRVLPAGHLEKNEKPLETARRELKEETGYTAKEFEYLGFIHEYPTKDLHKVHIVLAKNASRTSDKALEPGEANSISIMTRAEVQKAIKNGIIQSSSTIAALAKSGLLF